MLARAKSARRKHNKKQRARQYPNQTASTTRIGFKAQWAHQIIAVPAFRHDLSQQLNINTYFVSQSVPSILDATQGEQAQAQAPNNHIRRKRLHRRRRSGNACESNPNRRKIGIHCNYTALPTEPFQTNETQALHRYQLRCR